YSSLNSLKKPFLMAGFLIFMCAQLVWCSATGSISGVVQDPSGRIVPGVDVVAVNTGTGLKWTVTTNAAGFYSFQAMPVGTYELDVSKPGFKHYRQTGLVLNVNSALV